MMADGGNVRLEGHTDERGTREYNLALGERRANAVRDYMVASGVPGHRIETISYGEENPVATARVSRAGAEPPRGDQVRLYDRSTFCKAGASRRLFYFAGAATAQDFVIQPADQPSGIVLMCKLTHPGRLFFPNHCRRLELTLDRSHFGFSNSRRRFAGSTVLSRSRPVY